MKKVTRICSLAIVMSFVCVIGVLAKHNIMSSYEPPFLLPILNTLFASLIPLLVAYIAARTYLASAALNVLFMGCGMLAFGLGSLAAGWLRGMPGGVNMTVTVHNLGVLIGAVLQVAGIILTAKEITPVRERKRKKLDIIAVYSIIVVLIGFVTAAVLRQALPPFFIEGAGPTLLRQSILIMAMIFLTFSSFFFMKQYTVKGLSILYWYALALFLMDLNLLAIFMQKSVGSPIGWAGRFALYSGNIYALIAIRIAIKAAKNRGVRLEDVVSDFFLVAKENYRDLVETANDAIITFDEAGKMLLWNPAAEKMFGYHKNDVLGAAIFEMIVPEDQVLSIKEKIINHQQQTGERLPTGKAIETTGKGKDGRVFPMEFTLSARKMRSRWITTCIIRDITERKLADEEIRWRRFIHNIQAAVVVYDSDANILAGNTTAQKLLGLTEDRQLEKVITDRATEFFRKDMTPLPVAEYPVNQVMGSHQPLRDFLIGVKHPVKAGVRWVVVSADPLFDENERIHQIIATFIDITERINAENQMSQHVKTLDILHNVIVDITSTLDLDEVLKKVTRSATDLIGADGGSISLYDEAKDAMQYPYSHNMPAELQQAVIKTGRGVAEQVMRANTAIVIDNYPDHPKALKAFVDAGVKTVIGVPLTVKEKCFGTIAVFGMTPEKRFSREQLELLEGIGREAAIAIENAKFHEEIKRLSETLEQKVAERTSELRDTQAALTNLVDDLNQKQGEIETVNSHLLLEIAERQSAESLLHARNDELKAFTYTVSHDLKAPLRGIAGYAQELDRRHRADLSDRAQFCITQVLTATRNLDSLIEDLLHYSRLDTETPSLTEVNLGVMVEAILKDRNLVLAEQGVAVTVDIPFATLRTWERGLVQMLSNLIDNAIKYSRCADPPRIGIRAEDSGRVWRIAVSDNGIGFDMQYHDRIFGLFNRLVRMDEFEGTGAGLAIVKKVVDKLGGRIWAESAPDQGAIFFVEIPKPDN